MSATIGPLEAALQPLSLRAGELTLHGVRGPANGPPVVLLHGLMRRWQYLGPLLAALVPAWQVYALDLRGHGRSSWKPDGYRHYQSYVPDVTAFLRTFVREPAVLLGHSLGGLVALGAAAALPEGCRAVIAAESPLTPGSILGTVRLGAWAWVPQLAGKPPDRLYGLLRLMDREAPEAYLRETAEALHTLDPASVQYWAEDRMEELLADYDVDLTLARLRLPLLLVAADPAHGAVLGPDDIALARRQQAGVQVVTVPDVGHELGLDRGDVGGWLHAMGPFLAACRVAPDGR